MDRRNISVIQVYISKNCLPFNFIYTFNFVAVNKKIPMNNSNMYMKSKLVLAVILCLQIQLVWAQARISYNKKGQAILSAVQPFGKEAFNFQNETVIRWLGNAGFFINSRGTCIMIDPMLKGFDMPVLFQPPITPEEVPHLDAVLVTHCDNDHYSIPSCVGLSSICPQYHSTHYVDTLMRQQELPSLGHGIGEVFRIGPMSVKLTPAYHLWQNEIEEFRKLREYKMEDYCGFLINTPDGLIWAPGDSRFLPEFLELPSPDAIFFDFSDDSWHIGLEGAIKIANTYPDAELILSHWGTVDAPDMKPFNADPRSLEGRIINPERIRILNPGEPFILKRTAKETYSAKDRSNMVFKRGKQVTSEYYTGKVYISDIAHQTKFDINHLVFAPDSRNTWHIHPDAEQVLLILDGEGYYQEEGQEVILIKKGDIVRTPANVKHWHGSTSKSTLVHLSITEKTNKRHIEWIK